MKDFDKYVCVMFPYPSGEGLHVGHWYNYAIVDSYCRYLRYKGETVFQPFGYDAFGLPAENYARKVGGDPKTVTENNIRNFSKEMERMNTQYEYMLSTTDLDYQKLTQKIFLILKDRGLAYKSKGIQDFCPSCDTTLAKEQVKSGCCERCGTEVGDKELEQWYFKITDYKDRLIKNLDIIDYPKSTINAQRNWLENQHDWCISRQRKWGCPIPIEGETDTMDTFVDSSFYYIAYCWSKGIKPRPVDVYVGGNEHACMHLIYARFINMVLFDEGLVDFEEPFNKVIHQGMILNEGQKMSKSKGNAVSVEEYDSDEVRFYLMFIGHYFDGGSWSPNNIKGVRRFINKFINWINKEDGQDNVDISKLEDTISRYTETFKFNKVVSSFMTFINQNKSKNISKQDKNRIIALLEIFMPNIKNKI